MPRTTHTLQLVRRAGRGAYYQAKVNGRKVYLGTSKAAANRKLNAVLRGELSHRIPGRPASVAGLTVAYDAAHPNSAPWECEAWKVFADDGRLDLDDITPSHLSDYHDHLKSHTFRRAGKGGKLGPPQRYSARTIRHYVRYAASVLAWAHDQGWIKVLPKTPKTEAPRRAVRDMPIGTVMAALAELSASTRPIVSFLVFTGARPGEACSLRWDWFRDDIYSGRFVIPPENHKTGRRTGEPRTISLTPDARAIIDALQRRHAHVFVNRLGKPFTPAGIRSVTRRKKTPIKSPQSLRHTYATTALARGVPLHIVSELLGHRNITTTQRYARVLAEHAAEAASRLTGLLHAQSGDAAPSTPAGPKIHHRRA